MGANSRKRQEVGFTGHHLCRCAQEVTTHTYKHTHTQSAHMSSGKEQLRTTLRGVNELMRELALQTGIILP